MFVYAALEPVDPQGALPLRDRRRLPGGLSAINMALPPV
jgi:hypothetical protein